MVTETGWACEPDYVTGGARRARPALAGQGGSRGLWWAGLKPRHTCWHRRLFRAPLAIEPVSTTVFSGGAVAHVFAAHP
jgi:hypothetical protein